MRRYCGIWGEGEGSARPVADGEVEETGGVDWLAMMAEELRGGLADGVRYEDGVGREVRGDGSLVEGD